MKYNTRGRKELLALFSSEYDKAFSVEDVMNALPGMSQSTIYRLFSSLYEEGHLRRVESDSRSALYQYRDKENCVSHMHIRCRSCGQVEHIDESTSDQISRLIGSTLGFEALPSTMLDGICRECREKV